MVFNSSVSSKSLYRRILTAPTSKVMLLAEHVPGTLRLANSKVSVSSSE